MRHAQFRSEKLKTLWVSGPALPDCRCFNSQDWDAAPQPFHADHPPESESLLMHARVQRYKLRNLGVALALNMGLGLILYLFPWHLVPLSGPINSHISPYRYTVGLFAAFLAILSSKTEKGYYLILVGLIMATLTSLVLTFIEHLYEMDSLVDLNLYLEGIILYTYLQIRTTQKRWTKIIETPPRALDLHIEGKDELFNRMVMSPHLEINPEIIRNVNHFLEIQTEQAPLTLCFYAVEPVSEHVQAIAREAFQMYYQDEEYKTRKFIQSRYSRSVWMIVVSILAFRLMSIWSGVSNSSAFWEILSSFAAFSLWKVGDAYFEHTEALYRLSNTLIAKHADMQFM